MGMEIDTDPSLPKPSPSTIAWSKSDHGVLVEGSGSQTGNS